MPYCAYCDERLPDSALVAAPGRSAAGGAKVRDRCPTCGRRVDGRTPSRSDRATPPSGDGAPASGPIDVAATEEHGVDPDEGDEHPEEEVRPKAPWHFKLLVVGSVIYLGWRLYQGIGWLIHHA